MVLKELFYLGLCKTEKGKNCYFPFKLDGKSKNGCTKEDSPIQGAVWCATVSNFDSNPTKTKNWGYCMDSCPINCNKTRYFLDFSYCK